MQEKSDEIYRKKRKLSQDCFTKSGKLNSSSILFLFQDVAIDHVDAQGIGSDDLIKKNLLWVVTQTRYEIIRDPLMDEEVLLQTWFLPPRHGIVQREYLITDLKDEVYVKGSSYWVLMNANTRQIDDQLNEVLKGQKSHPYCNFEKRARFLRKIESEDSPLEITTTELAIDWNGHVNNVRYAEYMTKIAKEQMDHIQSFQIDYHKEMLCGEKLDLIMKETEKGILIQGTNKDHQLVFIGNFKSSKKSEDKMTRGEQARANHVPGTNCAQCILKACNEITELDENIAMAMGEGFGGGLRSGEICGVISGCVMVLGMAAKKKGIKDIRKATADLVAAFQSDFGCVRCEDLKGKKYNCNDLIEYGGNLIEKAIQKLDKQE